MVETFTCSLCSEPIPVDQPWWSIGLQRERWENAEESEVQVLAAALIVVYCEPCMHRIDVDNISVPLRDEPGPLPLEDDDDDD